MGKSIGPDGEVYNLLQVQQEREEETIDTGKESSLTTYADSLKDSGYDQSFEDFKTGMSSDEDERKSQLTELHESSGENSIEDAINQLDVTASEPGKTLKDEIIPIIRETGHLNVFLGCPELPPTISSHIQKDQSETATEKEWMDKLNNEEKEKNVAEKFQEEILQSIKTESEKLEEDDEIEK